MVAGKIDLCNSGGEGGVEAGTSGTLLLENLKFSRQPVRNNCRDKCTNYRKSAADERNVVRGYVLHGMRLEYWGLSGGFGNAGSDTLLNCKPGLMIFVKWFARGNDSVGQMN